MNRLRTVATSREPIRAESVVDRFHGLDLGLAARRLKMNLEYAHIQSIISFVCTLRNNKYISINYLKVSFRLVITAEEGNGEEFLRSHPDVVVASKACISSKARETVSLGRELLGGNGVVGDFLVAKAFCDIEPIYTYEGTYDINTLVTAREVTGIASFKPAASRSLSRL